MFARKLLGTLLALTVAMTSIGTPAVQADWLAPLPHFNVDVTINNATQVAVASTSNAPPFAAVCFEFHVTLAANPTQSVIVPHLTMADANGNASSFFPLAMIVSAGEFYARVRALTFEPTSSQARVSQNDFHFSARWYNNVQDLQSDNLEAYVAIFGTQNVTVPFSGPITLPPSTSYGFVPSLANASSGHVVSASRNLFNCVLPSGPAGVLGTN